MARPPRWRKLAGILTIRLLASAGTKSDDATAGRARCRALPAVRLLSILTYPRSSAEGSCSKELSGRSTPDRLSLPTRRGVDRLACQSPALQTGGGSLAYSAARTSSGSGPVEWISL